MGHIILQMMMTLDGMVSGPNGELDWIADDDGKIQQEHLKRVEQAEAIILGVGAANMSTYWKAAEHDEKAAPLMRSLGRALNKIPKIIYSHKERQIDWNNTKVHVVKDDKALVEDIEHLKQEIKGSIVTYGGVRFARTLLQHDLLDEIHLDICPVILGVGKPLFTDLTHRTNLELIKCETYSSGATMMHYKVVRKEK